MELVAPPQKSGSSDLTSALAQLLKSAGDPLRLDILRALSTDSFGVLELSYVFDLKQSGMSHHLKVLAKTGLVTTRREGNSIFYRRSHVTPGDELSEIRHALNDTIEQLALDEAIKKRIQDVYAQRAKTSQSFFVDNADKFKEQQDLIAAFEVYGGQVEEFLNQTPLPSTESAMEIGPGQGEFLETLSKRFNTVVALDNSPSMLEKAQELNADKGLHNIHFECQNTSFCQQTDQRFDCIIINMVLHHVPSPNQVFGDITPVLKRDGAVIVCDLCHHDQDWAREACGDLWLGFEPNDLREWALENQLREGQSVYFALRNGFQIQIRQFFKS